eukprot:2943560-Rhodomonas_salina.3
MAFTSAPASSSTRTTSTFPHSPALIIAVHPANFRGSGFALAASRWRTVSTSAAKVDAKIGDHPCALLPLASAPVRNSSSPWRAARISGESWARPTYSSSWPSSCTLLMLFEHAQQHHRCSHSGWDLPVLRSLHPSRFLCSHSSRAAPYRDSRRLADRY